jgi:hypothetical protein
MNVPTSSDTISGLAAWQLGALRAPRGEQAARQPGSEKSAHGKDEYAADQDSRIRRCFPERECFDSAAKRECSREPSRDTEADDHSGLAEHERAYL